jgi:hypothetical protein
MITAKEAFDKTIEFNKERHEKTMAYITQRIDEAIADYKFCINLRGGLNTHVIINLEKLGYSVNTTYNGYSVSWYIGEES